MGTSSVVVIFRGLAALSIFPMMLSTCRIHHFLKFLLTCESSKQLHIVELMRDALTENVELGGATLLISVVHLTELIDYAPEPWTRR